MEKIQAYENNYPQTLRRIFVINASKVSLLLYKLVTPFFHHNLVEQIRMYGYNKEEWQAALLEEIEADQLPAYYGGTLTDPDGDERCLSKWNMGGKVPRSYYLSNTMPIPKEKMQMINIRPGAGGRKKLKINVDVINSIIRYEFMTEGGDIAYRIYRKCPEEGVVELVPLHRVASHLNIESDEIVCDKIGLCVYIFSLYISNQSFEIHFMLILFHLSDVIQFDNTFSYFQSKKVHYTNVIIEPTQHEIF